MTTREEREFLKGVLGKITDLRKNLKKLEAITGSDELEEPLWSTTLTVVQAIMDGYTPEAVESLMKAMPELEDTINV